MSRAVFRLIPLALGCCWIGLAQPARAQAPSPNAPPKISGEFFAHREEKRLPPGVRADVHARNLQERGLNSKALDSEDCALYVTQPLTPQKIAALRGQGVTVHETYVPPVPGKHPNGFYLTTVRYASVDQIQNDPQFVRLETTEQLVKPLNDLGAIQTHVDDVHNGSGVPARNGAGVRIAIADTGVDRTHADIPTPTEAYDMTDGTGPSTWGTNVANTVSDHGTHVTGTAVGSGSLSAGRYQGMAPGAMLYFYKIGNDTTGSASETDEIEAVNRALAVGCDIFSMSFGGVDTYMDGTNAMCQAIDAAVAGGMSCFISAGNEAQANTHDSLDVAPGTTSSAFSYTTTAGSSATGTVYFRVIWRDGSAGDANMVMACSNLGGGESLVQTFTGSSTRGTDSKQYRLTTNTAAGVSKTYSFTLQNTAGTGNTPKVHLYETSTKGTFGSPDASYTVGNPAIADGAIAVGAWTQRRNWTNYQGLGYYYSTYTVGTLAPFSSLGPRIDGTTKPDVVAPGAATISTRDSVPGLAATSALIIDNDGLNLNGSGPANYYIKSGTSMACPHAAGLAALVLEAQPTLTPAQLRTILTATASQAGSPNNSVGSGLLNALSAVVYDIIPPTVSMASTASNPTKISPIPVTVTLSESSTNFASGDITPTNATVTGFSGSGTAYSFNLNPSGQGTVSAAINAGVFTDAAGNGNTAATPLSRTYDSIPPTVSMASTASNPTNISPIPVTVTLSESSTNFASGDITPTNATVTGFSGSGTAYSFNLNPSGQGTVSAAINAGVFTDAAGNGNTAATPLSRIYDSVAPTATMASTASNPTNISPIPVTVTLSESSTNFTSGDITPTNATVTGFSGSGTAYSFNLNPSGQGTVSAAINAGVFTDAAGNGNTAATPLNRTYDSVAPTVSMSSTASNPTNISPIPVTVTLSESSTNFASGDITPTSAAVTGFTGSGTAYSFNLNPSGQGTVSAAINAGVFTDAAGNGNTAATPLSRTYDSIPPTATIGPVTPDPRDTAVASVSTTFTESVTGVVIEDFSLTCNDVPVALTGAGVTGSGSSYTVTGLSALTGTGGTYVLTLTALGSGIQDAAGNALAANASDTWVLLDQLSITVTPTTWTLGMRPLGYVGVSGPYTIANNGNVAENVAIKAGDGAGGWLLADVRATDAFSVETDFGHDGSFEMFLRKIDRPLFGNLASGATQTLGLRYSGPNEDSKGGGVAQNFTITFTASKYVP